MNLFSFFYLKFLVVICLFAYSLQANAQPFTPGETYWDSTGFVEYKAGNLPIIISVPHGGNWAPDSIPDRDCVGCLYLIDSYTRIISWELYDVIYNITGCYPHMIMNRLHRRKFDANRDIGDAADGNPLIESAWYNYHEFIDSAKVQIEEDYDRGLFLDVHGHGHTIQRIELGYLLSKNELELSDSILNTATYIEESSIRSLEGDNESNVTHAELLRGPNSFGTLMDTRGFPSVPSANDPSPSCGGSCYFSGGYNTERHGSRDNLGPIDAIQIELDSAARSSNFRWVLVDSLAATINDYFTLHYDNSFGNNNYCEALLPVELLDFKAHFKKEDSQVYLNWATASETNNDFFMVEKSLDGRNWMDIERVEGQGTSMMLNHYFMIDKDLHFGAVHYYRLKQIDFDGSINFSPIQSIYIANNEQAKYKVFPNPVEAGGKIICSNQDEISSMKLYSITGREYSSPDLMNGQLPVDLPSGVYLVRMELPSNKFEFVKLIVK